MRTPAEQDRKQDAIILSLRQSHANAQEWLRRAHETEARLLEVGLTLQERIDLVKLSDALRDRAFEELRLIPWHMDNIHGYRQKCAA